MAALITLALASAAAPEAAIGPDRVARWAGLIHEAAGRAAIPDAWVRRVIRAESAGRTALGGRPITSRAGAMGLMQLMPATWAAMRARLGLGADPFDPHDNIVAGAAFLRMMYDRFGYPGLFGAYNAGPGRYAAHLAGRPLPVETSAYMVKVGAGDGASQGGQAALAGASGAVRPALFVALHSGDGPGLTPSEQPPSLFAVRHDLAGAAGASGR